MIGDQLAITDTFITLIGIISILFPAWQVITWIAVLLAWLIAYCFLEDWTVLDTNDPEEDESIDEVSGFDMRSAQPMIRLQRLRRWFPNVDQLIHCEEDEHPQGNAAIKSRAPNYKMYRTQYARNNERQTSLCSGLMDIVNQVFALLRLRSTWRVLMFGFSTSAIAMQWTFSDMVLPPFLERRFGENIPIYTIQSINLFGCLIFPPVVGALTSGKEDFSIIMPGKCRYKSFVAIN